MLRLLKETRISSPIAVVLPRLRGEDSLDGIRCPICAWRPRASSLWSCDCRGTPEPFFQSCGAAWNTFLTRGRCPGCDHQWQWTTCLACGQSSLHDDWYETAIP